MANPTASLLPPHPHRSCVCVHYPTHAGVSAQVFGQRVLVGRPDWVLSQLPGGQASAAAAAHLQQQLVPPEASGARLTQVARVW